MSEQNKDVVRKIEAAWDEQRLDELDRYFAPEFDNSQSGRPGLPVGLDGAKESQKGTMAAFPDRRVEILDIIAENDKVFVRSRARGTNTGGFPPLGIGPNGNQFEIECWSLYRLKDGKVVEHAGINDAFKMARQLSATPVPSA